MTDCTAAAAAVRATLLLSSYPAIMTCSVFFFHSVVDISTWGLGTQLSCSIAFYKVGDGRWRSSLPVCFSLSQRTDEQKLKVDHILNWKGEKKH